MGRVDMVLAALTPDRYTEDGETNYDGMTKDEARKVLTAALYILDTEAAPEFSDEFSD